MENTKHHITVSVTVEAPIEKVWECFNNPKDIEQWYNASDDWHTPSATNDLQVGGTFNYRMEAKDKSFGFDFFGTYTKIEDKKLIDFVLGDDRKVSVSFLAHGNATHVIEKFEPESQNPMQVQEAGWHAILNNFKKYTEGKK